jgi:glutaminyl-tRNA synthetase
LPESKSGADTSGIQVKGTLHWVAVQNAVTAEVRLYERLFKIEDISSYEGDFKDMINPDSLEVVKTVYAELPLNIPKWMSVTNFTKRILYTRFERYLS